MRKLFISIILFFSLSLFSQNADEYVFETIYDLPVTSVKDQFRSGTCWSFSACSFLESEMLRIGKKQVDLSPMYSVRINYEIKAQKYVRMHGDLTFAAGGLFHDVVNVLRDYGAIPTEAYKGLNYGQDGHVHGEIDELLKSYVDVVVKNKNKQLSTSWLLGYNGILDAYFGQIPEKFTYEGKSYTPQSFAKEAVGLNPDDYVQVTSFTHHPFYTAFGLEIPDNYSWGNVYNVKLDDLITIATESLKSGYTVGWATDVSEPSFSHASGIAVMPVDDVKDLSDSERGKWEKVIEKSAPKQFLTAPYPEKEITQESRQIEFDNYKTTDDHGMHIVGLVKDQNGTLYFKVKNSWNTDNKYNGYLYASVNYVKAKSTAIMVNKNAIPKEIRNKLGIK